MAGPVANHWPRFWLFFLWASFGNVKESAAAVFYPESFTLSNGMQVIVVENHLAPVVAQMVWYKVGAVDDPLGVSGLAHYLEHMMFKGTYRVPEGRFSATIAARGGEENAFTTRDSTAYHEEIALESLPLAMQLEADRMQNLHMTPSLAASELSVVLNERQERTDNDPQGLFIEQMTAALYQDHPYSRPVIGYKNEIEKITPEKAMAFYRRFYAPNNAILVVSGDVKTFDVLRLAAATFGRIPTAPQEKKDMALQPVSVARLAQMKRPEQKFVERRDLRVTQATIYHSWIFPELSKTSRLSYALEVLSEIFSSGEVGWLYKNFVIDAKTASMVAASYDSVARGPASFVFSATPSPEYNAQKLQQEILGLIKKASRAGFTPQEVERAKQRLLDSAVFARDNLMAPAQVLGQFLVSGQSVQDVEFWPERIRAVTPQEVKQALRYLVDCPYDVVGLLAPAEKKEAAP